MNRRKGIVGNGWKVWQTDMGVTPEHDPLDKTGIVRAVGFLGLLFMKNGALS
jgi:hypothetical protein